MLQIAEQDQAKTKSSERVLAGGTVIPQTDGALSDEDSSSDEDRMVIDAVIDQLVESSEERDSKRRNSRSASKTAGSRYGH